MSAFFTSSFMRRFPDLIHENLFNDDTSINLLRKAVGSNRFMIITDSEVLLKILDNQKKEDSDILNYLSALYSANKIQAVNLPATIPPELSKLKLGIETLKSIAGAITEGTDTVCHDKLENLSLLQDLIKTSQKSIFTENDFLSNRIDFLFTEKSIPLNIDEKFNWSDFLLPYVMPYKTIRILDPYLYKKIDEANLDEILRTLIRLSDDKVIIQIISNFPSNTDRNHKIIEGKVLITFNTVNACEGKIELYSQLSDPADNFHKRLIWTDFWVVGTDRSFNFLKIKSAKGSVKKENTLFMAGKYASDNSLWNQVNNNWDEYLDNSKLVIRI